MTEITRDRIEALMKRCQIGVGYNLRTAIDTAHSIMAECYGTLGAMMIEIERMREWIDGDCICPCCRETRSCLRDCTFATDAPEAAERMALARAARFGENG
jgi:hypothetical protein